MDEAPAESTKSPLSAKAKAALKRHFGHKHFRPGQAEVITRLLSGQSTLALLPTGGGKSLTYQIPALLLPGTTLILSPLLALMRDQVESLRKRGIPAARLDSTLSLTEQEAVLGDLQSGRLKLLYLSPERLHQPACLEILKSLPCPLIAVDEAHCLVEWGHHFRPDYLRLARLPELFPGVPLLALTATAPPAAAASICRAFRMEAEAVVRTPLTRPNLRLYVKPTPVSRRLTVLAGRLAAAGRQPAIVYVTRQETAESVSTALQRRGFAARAYHAGLPDDQRSEAQDHFLSGQCQVMVATTAFGMGIDLPGIRAVFHYDLPRSLENYLQETGRAGRDGRTAHAEFLGSAEDRTALENSILGDTPAPEGLRLCLDSLLRQGPAPAFSRWQLSRHADVRPAVLDTLLARLEMDGVLAPGPSTWLSCRVKLLRRMDQIAAGHPPREQAWIRYLLDNKDLIRGRIHVALAEAARALETEPETLATFLRGLEIQGDLTVRPQERQETWFLLQPDISPAQWFRKASEAIATLEQAALHRLASVVEFFSSPGCLERRLLAWFGENSGATGCGHCSRCRYPDKTPVPLPAAPERTVTLEETDRIRLLVRERLPALRHPRQLARFLCGLSSPATWRDHLTRHDGYGLLADVPFDTVLAHAEASL